mgnify:CR=1 FL=1
MYEFDGSDESYERKLVWCSFSNAMAVTSESKTKREEEQMQFLVIATPHIVCSPKLSKQSEPSSFKKLPVQEMEEDYDR